MQTRARAPREGPGLPGTRQAQAGPDQAPRGPDAGPTGSRPGPPPKTGEGVPCKSRDSDAPSHPAPPRAPRQLLHPHPYFEKNKPKGCFITCKARTTADHSTRSMDRSSHPVRPRGTEMARCWPALWDGHRVRGRAAQPAGHVRDVGSCRQERSLSHCRPCAMAGALGTAGYVLGRPALARGESLPGC